MVKFLRALFSNAILPAILFVILGFLFFLIWNKHPYMGPAGKNTGMARFLSISWPYFVAAFVSNQATFYFSKNSIEGPLWIGWMNGVAVLIGFFYLIVGPHYF